MSALHCVAEKACRAAKTVDGIRQPAATAQAGTLCDVCHEAITSAIKQLPRDWTLLRATIGERAHSDGPKISSTPTSVIPINTRKDALMRTIIELTDQAAAIVSDALHTDQPTGGRKPPKDAEPGSVALLAAENSHPSDAAALKAAIAIIEPNIDLLAGAGPGYGWVWTAPKRCTQHRGVIRATENILEMVKRIGGITTDAEIALRDAYTAAGACDNCNAWGEHGQQRALAEHTGIQIALDLADLHHQTRAELGKTRLRHRYAMPCPHCGGRIGRDDGQTVVNCDKCESSWTEREYKFLAGLIVDERQDMEIVKWLLAEAYWRLDRVKTGLEIAATWPLLDTAPNSGRVVVEGITEVIEGHKPPAQRVIATDKKTAELRQDTDDTGQWGERQTAYIPPKPKRKRQRVNGKTATHIHPSSLTTLTDIDENIDTSPGLICPECRLIHAGECA